ncbi:MAG TPA: SDR family oxidoreductase, partial [Flavisolibacter sp.]|nr:SDR family oxidoreductase [Flavisolibacter sp.]
KEGYGRIINIISTSVRIPINNLGVSNTIRWAVASWAKTMANELGQYGITVNNVLPGYTLTDRLQSLVQHNAKAQNTSEEAVMDHLKNEIPAKRFGKPEEVAAFAAFLATSAAAYINGTSTAVDGGKTGSM